MRAIVAAILAIVFVLAVWGLCPLVRAALSHEIASPAGVIVNYGGLKSPKTGQSCCNQLDCAPAEVMFDPERGLMIRRLDGYPVIWDDPWYEIDKAVVLPIQLDGMFHMCKMASDPAPRCIIQPPGL